MKTGSEPSTPLHMAASLDSGDVLKRHILELDYRSSDDGSCRDAVRPSLSGGEGACALRSSSKELQASLQETSSTEDLRRRCRNSSGPETRKSSPMTGGGGGIRGIGEGVVFCSGNSPFKGRSSFLSAKTEWRPTDSPAGKVRRSGRSLMSGVSGNAGNDGFSDEDIPEEFKMMESSTLTWIQSVSLIFISAALISSLSVPAIKKQRLWDLNLWKWEVMLLVIICGRLCSAWGVRVVVFFIERNFLLRKRVLYFVYGLKKAVQHCLWLGLVLIIWNCIFDDKVEREIHTRVLPFVTKILLCLLVGTFIWLLKTLAVKVLALTFHVNAFFERIQESLFNQYVIETLSMPPLVERGCFKEDAERAFDEAQKPQNTGASPRSDLRASPHFSRSGRPEKSPKVGRSPRFFSNATNTPNEEITIDQLHMLNHHNISAWNMKRLMNIILHGSLYTLDERVLNSNAVDESSLEIQSEFQARMAANKIFHNVAKTGSRYINLDDLLCFMREDEAVKTMHLFDGANDGISKLSLKNWMVNAFRERKALSLSLKDTNTAVNELQRFLNLAVGIIFAVVCLLILDVRVKHFLVFVSSQLLLLKFIFGNFCKTLFEAIIFLFVMHPFDVGDRCEVDGVQMVVEEMKIFTTAFLRYDNQKIIYPNSTLATKAIGNYYRSPDMGDSIDFCIHISTPADKITTMKDRIKSCVESNTEHWGPGTMIVMKGVERMNGITMMVGLTHTMNHHDMGERWARRALLVEELVKAFRELDIEYRLLPFEVKVNRASPPSKSKIIARPV